MASFTQRLKHAFNAFSKSNELAGLGETVVNYGPVSSFRPDRTRLHFSNERSIITSIYARICVDLASVQFKHVRLDDKGRYISDMPSGLNNCLTIEANIDQAASDFKLDYAQTLCNTGFLALVPIDTSENPNESASFDIETMRVGEVVAWFPKHVRVNVFNEEKGRRQEITLRKKNVAIVYNPLYAIMNEPNSTLQRIIRKLNYLDAVDEQSASGKLDIIIQLPYVIKSETRRQQAEQRRSDIEFQLKGSKYGIAYTDGTEKITQLNRPAENNLMGQIEYLMKMLYGQLGLTEGVMNGTATEAEMLNYWSRTIEPISRALQEAMHRTFLTKTARSQKQAIRFFKDPFKFVPISQLAEIADKFTRNEIFSSNEIRQIVGVAPSDDPKADQLVNSNMPQAVTNIGIGGTPEEEVDETDEEMGDVMDDAFNSLETSLDGLLKDLGA